MDKDFMLNYFSKAVQPEWEERLKTPRYQQAASKRDAIEQEFLRMMDSTLTHIKMICSVGQGDPGGKIFFKIRHDTV